MSANTHLGFRSRLVLEKLGFDLRRFFDGQVSEPLPPRIQRLADELAGYAEWRDVGAPPQEAAAGPDRPDERWRWALASDEPFAFR